MTLPKNAKGKNFSWSPSAISDFITCPAQYAAKRFYCTLPYVESEAMRQGTIEHKHLEDRLVKKTPLPEGYTRGEKYCRAFEGSGGKIFAEREFAITPDLKVVSWFDKQAWGRCKLDVTVIHSTKVSIFDYKTGKIKEDSLQLKINACVISLDLLEIETFVTRYIWLKHNTVTGETFTKAQIPELWDEILHWVYAMTKAWQTETFPARKSGLCRNYCAVTSCVHCGK